MKRRVKGRKRKQMQRRALLIGGMLAASALVVFLIVYFSMKSTVNKVAKDTIWNNVYIEDVEVSGMKADEAKEALEAQIVKYQSKKVELVADETAAEVTLGDLGFHIEDLDKLIKAAVSYGKEGSVWARHEKFQNLKKEAKRFEVTYGVDEETVKKTIPEKIPHLKNEAQDATITRQDGKFVLTEERAGKKIDIEKSMKVIEEYFQGDWENSGNKKISLKTVVQEPSVTKEQLSQIQDVLGTFSTYFGRGKSNREKNIINATSRINGIVMMPGDILSASEAMGKTTEENGYFAAGSYLDGEVVDSVGGGVCQVSTTLYNAVILAELEITERWSHSMLVDYVKPSMDAAIAEGYKDLKFKNNTDAPVYIEGIIKNGNVVFTVYGKETRAEGRKVTYESEELSRTPAKKKFVASNDAVGTLKVSVAGHDAVKAKLWKIVTENGVEVSRKVMNNSSYRTSAATYVVGTATDHAEAKKVLTDAIQTQNEATIRAAIANAQAIIAAASQPTAGTPSTAPETP